MLEIGQKAPDFSLPGVDGQIVSLSTLLGSQQAVIVVFSCNHCPYVRAWEPRMIDIQAEYSPKGAVLVAINANDDLRYPEDNFDSMKERARQMHFNFPYLRDGSQDTARAYGATHTPHVFLLDNQGVLRYRGAIDDNYDNPDAVSHTYLRDALDAVLSGSAPAIATSGAVGCTIKWKG